MKHFLLFISLLLILRGFSQDSHKHSFKESYERYRYAGMSTTKIIVDSIYQHCFNALENMSLDEFYEADSILTFEISQARTIQNEFYWNTLYSKILDKNNFIGKDVQVLNRNLEIAQFLNDTDLLATAYDKLSNFYYSHYLNDKALEYIWKTRDVAFSTDDSLLQIRYAGGIAWKLTNIAYDMQNPALQDSAVKYALVQYTYTPPEKSGEFTEATFVAALCMARANKREESIVLVREALSRQIEPIELPGRAYGLMQEQFIMLGMKDSAYAYGQKIIEWSLQNESNRMPQLVLKDGRKIYIHAIDGAIRAYLHFKDFEKAVELIDLIRLNDELNTPDILYTYRSYGVRAFQGIGNLGLALEWQLAANKYSDSLERDQTENDNKVNREILEASILMEQKNAEENKIQQALILESESKNKRLQFWIFSIGILGLFALMFVMYSRYSKTKKQKLLIEEQKIKVEEAHEEIKDSIAYAKRIQTAILPPIKTIKEVLPESFVLYKPKDVVAGDFYWLEKIKSGVLFAVADCTGHGVPGAMVSVICNGALNRAVREFGLIEPGEILNKAREIVIQEFEKSEEVVKDGMDIALCYLNGRSLNYAGANNPLWIMRNGEIIEFKANKQPIGQFDQAMPFNTTSINLEEGDIIYLFSDGFIDQFGGEKGKKLRAKYLRELLIQGYKKPMEEQKIFLDTFFENWRGTLEQIDDVCLVGVRV